MAPKNQAIDPATDYARKVAAGEIVAGKFVKQAAKRHLADLENGAGRGLFWKPQKAEQLFAFFALLRHWKGRWAGQPFKLEPWQYFVLGLLWGWRRADGTRRFRVLHLEVARKNGKSTLAAGMALALLILDNEAGAEIYCCATKRDQAKITFSDAAKMVKASTALKAWITASINNLAVLRTDSKLEPLAADGGKLDGLNVHGAICDELHAWPKRGLWDVLETAAGSRAQPLFVITTTAGHNRQSIWWELRERAIKVLDGVFENDEVLALIWTLDDGDDWKDETKWIKANPNLNVSIRHEEIGRRCLEAQQSPGQQNPFKRLRLNVPTEQADRWLDLDRWDKCAETVPEILLSGRECFGALDLSQTLDLTAWALVFPPNDVDPKWRVLVRLFLPEDRVHDRVEKDRVPYDLWSEDGLIKLTEGNVVDYDAVKAQVLRDAETFVLRELAFDRRFALPVVQQLQGEGVECIDFAQGFASYAAPVKEFERLLVAEEIAVPADKCLRWQAGNVAVRTDVDGNQRPDKGASSEKIDAIVAILMALARALVTTLEPDDGAGLDYFEGEM